MAKLIAISRDKRTIKGRIRNAKKAYNAYRKTGRREKGMHTANICDLIADLLHLAESYGEADASNIAAISSRHYREEADGA